ncbi:sugar ABC transporter substrate-binding protein [uncultured Roseobacter sp.]|uniref:sugar ABC transporter substrate-binding protein n=1 Tax=uncultured Roseobacter sp. TaxID=114847 RepID=UPI0026224890|nr:sugar ABC transporter substrate-binding protein [uncultured Roseobacter sp.]
MKLINFVAAAATGILLSTGIAIAEEKPVVGLIMKSLANEFFQNMLEGAEAHAEARGDYELRAVGMQNETDFESQINAVENFITQGVDAIVVAPADSKAMVRPLKRAMEAGIVVVNFDVALDEGAKKQQGVELAFVGPDNRGGAKLAGDALGQALGEGAKVVIIEGNPGADNATQRRMGFEDSVAEYKLELLDSRTAHWETEEANQLLANMLTANPDIQGVMAANDSMAIGAVKALEAAGRTDIKVVGFDAIPAVLPMIEDGRLLASVDQFGKEMAANSIDLALEVVAGGPALEGWVKTPIELVSGK